MGHEHGKPGTTVLNLSCICGRRRSSTGYDPEDPRAVANPYLSAQGHNVLDVKFCRSLQLCLSKHAVQHVLESCVKQDALNIYAVDYACMFAQTLRSLLSCVGFVD